MIKFSAGYNKINPNFVIQGLNEAKNCLPAFSIMRNILTRGCPTIPSRLLRKKFGEPNLTDDFKYYLNFKDLHWDETIKGGSNSNPALDLYKRGFSNYLKLDERFAGSFIPECSIQDIIYDYKAKKNVDSHVDFYSPIYKNVIEVDGRQHHLTEQNVKDEKRDSILSQHGIDTFRISTRQMSNYVSRLDSLDEVTKCLESDDRNLSKNEMSYLYAIRFELFLNELYANGVLSLDDKEFGINVHTNYKIGSEPILTMISDYYMLLKDVLALQNIEFEEPRLYLCFANTDDELSRMDGINVDISFLQVYCDRKYKNVYYIRNDYFLYEDRLHFNDDIDTYWYKKNNYQISFNKVSYHVNIKEHAKPLRNLLRNLSSSYDDFREKQLEIITSLLNERAVIGILPTGAGKSLCYQLCSLLIPSMTLVVAPLQLLMADQERNIKKNFGITNVAVINAMTKTTLEIFKNKQSLISIISPERFFSISFSTILKDPSFSGCVGFIVIDEVHCLSEWGHDFRTSYLCLSHNLSSYFPKETYLMALTGTASQRVFEDVALELSNFKDGNQNRRIKTVFAANMKRNNLKIEVIQTRDYYAELKKIMQPVINGSTDKMLIFTKKKTGDEKYVSYESACIPLMSHLARDYSNNNLGDKMSYYVGGNDLESEEKIEVLNNFASGKKTVVLATKAFGMGVDIEDIRTTVHYGIPSSLEGLYQEMGRAGRDGLESKCYVIYKRENPQVIRSFFRTPMISISDIKRTYNGLNELNTNFYFIQRGNLDPEIESQLIVLIYNMIKEHQKNSSSKGIDAKTFMKAIIESGIDLGISESDLDRVRDLVEKAFYRLFLLGEIEMWSVVYEPSDITNPTYTDLRLTNLTEEQKLERLKNHITKYQNTFDFDSDNTFENRLMYLIKWVNENYLYERIQGMKNLYNQCLDFKSSDDFMSYIDNYFSNDPLYSKIVDEPERLTLWINAIAAPPEQTKERLARLLESYNQIVGLNYVSGITRLRLGEFDDPDGKDRLDSAFNDIGKLLDEKTRRELFKRTYNIIEETCYDEFVSVWIQHFPSDVKYICEETNNKVAENFIIQSYVKEILELGGQFNDKL